MDLDEEEGDAQATADGRNADVVEGEPETEVGPADLVPLNAHRLFSSFSHRFSYPTVTVFQLKLYRVYYIIRPANNTEHYRRFLHFLHSLRQNPSTTV